MINLFILLGLIISGCENAVKKAVAPNIVIILADDLGYGDLKTYNAASKIPTPHLDALAMSGMKFTDAHTPSSVCTPTRYGLLTGRYAWRSALKQSVLWSWDRPLIEKGRLTIASMLRENKYSTACIGKWHLGWYWPGQEGEYINENIQIGDFALEGRNELHSQIDFSKSLGGGPLEAGFDYYFGDDVPNFPPYSFIENDQLVDTPDQMKPDSMFGNPGPMTAGWDLTEVMPTITQKATDYIQEKSKEENPFFLYFALTAPHTPIATAREFIGKSEAGLYGDYVHQVDHTVGEVVKALKESGQWENTILIFSSDNGSPQRDGTNMAGPPGSVKKYGHDPSHPFRGMKADIWEGGHRVPLITTWPGKINAGTISHQLFCLTDIISTLANILDIQIDSSQAVDSRDFSQVFLENTVAPVRASLVHHSIRGMFAIRKGPWKYIDGLGSGGWSKDTMEYRENKMPLGQLYHMNHDSAETKNVYFDHPGIVDRLKKELEKIQKAD